MQCLTVFISCLLLLLPNIGQAEIYRYIDPQGRLLLSKIPRTGKQYIPLIKTENGWVPKTEQGLSRNNQKNFAQYVQNAAQQHRLPYQLIHAVITVESAYNPEAISHAGAQGLMQLMPATAKRFGVDNPFDPEENIEGGSRYLKHLLQLFEGDVKLALAAYNAGENAVQRYGNRIPPYQETREYVQKVLKTYQKYRFAQTPSWHIMRNHGPVRRKSHQCWL